MAAAKYLGMERPPFHTLWNAARSIRMERNPVPYVWNATLFHTSERPAAFASMGAAS